MVPVCLVPIIGTLLWAQNKAKKEHRIRYSRPSFGPTLHREAGVGFFQHIKQLEYRALAHSWSAATFKTLKEMDVSFAVVAKPTDTADRWLDSTRDLACSHPSTSWSCQESFPRVANSQYGAFFPSFPHC